MPNKRILLVGPFSAGQLPASFARACERLGYEVIRFDADQAYFSAGFGAGSRLLRRLRRGTLWNRLNQQTIDVARSVRPALLLVVRGSYLHAETIRRLRRELGVPVANYYPDDPYIGVPWNPRKESALRRDLLGVLREYTRVWIWERGLASRLVADNVAAAYLPFGVDPDLFHPLPPSPCAECAAEHVAVFVGKHHDKREAHIGAVRQHSVGLWGPRWQRAAATFNGQHVVHQRDAFAVDCAQLYSSAAVSLNVLADHNLPGHNMRTFEIPASGGLMVATYTAEQAEFFSENEAALYYRDPTEIDELIARVLCDRSWARALRQRALATAAQHHYAERMKVIATELGL